MVCYVKPKYTWINIVENTISHITFLLFKTQVLNLGVVTNSTENIFLLQNKVAAWIPFIIKIISFIYQDSMTFS